MKLAIKLTLALLLVFAAKTASAQNCAIAPVGIQFFGNDGQPLSGGYVVTTISGTTTPAVTYSNSSCTSPLPLSVPLDSYGRPYPGSGGLSGIWLNTSLVYRFTLEDSTLSVIWTLDGITAASGGGGSGSTNYWTLSGNTISNNNNGGTGPVTVGSTFTVGSNLFVGGGLELQDTQASPNYAIIVAPACVGTYSGTTCSGANTTWRWPAVDAPGALTSDGSGNLSFQGGGGGGGGGSAAGPSGAVQLSNGSGAFINNANLNFNTSTQSLVISSTMNSVAGVIVTPGYVQADYGFNAVNNTAPTTPLPWNVISATYGGMKALSFSANNYMETGNSTGVPTATTGESGFPHAGTVYCDTTTSPCIEKLWNGSAWVALATGGATSPGGSSSNVQYNSGGSFGGNNNFEWNTTSNPGNPFLSITASSDTAGLDISNGFAQADDGFYVSSGIFPAWTNVNVPTGGVYARSLYATTYVGTGTSAGPPGSGSGAATLTPGQPAFSNSNGLGTLYCDTRTVPCVEYLWNGSAWLALGSGGGGGVAGPNNSVQYNLSGTQAGSANLTFASNVLNITGALSISGATSINTSNQFVGAAVNATGIVQSQVTGSAIAFQNGASSFLVNGNGIVSALGMNINTPGGNLSVAGTTTTANLTVTGTCTGCGGVTSVLGTANEVIANTAGSVVTLSTPQPIATSSTPTFANVVASGVFQSAVTGTAIGFQISNNNFLVNGNGLISTAGGININGAAVLTIGTGGLTTTGSVIATGSGNGTFAGGVTATAGLTTSNTATSNITIGALGNLYTRLISSSTGVSCSGVPNGWIAVSQDAFIVICANNVRSRAALVTY